MLPQLNFPRYEFRLREEDGRLYIFDSIRRKWLLLTPEEWVRQHWVTYLIQDRGFPAGWIGLEKSFRLNTLSRRFDIIAGNPPRLLVECKSPDLVISQKTFDQIFRYNIAWNVPWLVISNGLNHFACRMNQTGKNFEFVPDIPHFSAL